jgi:hypothetical protein
METEVTHRWIWLAHHRRHIERARYAIDREIRPDERRQLQKEIDAHEAAVRALESSQ